MPDCGRLHSEKTSVGAHLFFFFKKEKKSENEKESTSFRDTDRLLIVECGVGFAEAGVLVKCCP